MLKELFPHFNINPSYLDQSQVFHQNTASLIELFSTSKPALCIIDLQRRYCDSALKGNHSTESIIEPIVQLKEAFNRYDRPVYVVYMDGYEAGIDAANGGLYGIELNKDKDIPIPKDSDSVFRASQWCGGINISDSFEENGVDTLFFAGVHFSVCIEASAREAVKNYNTYVVSDCTANGQTRGMVSPTHTVRLLSERGVKFVNGDQISSAINTVHLNSYLEEDYDQERSEFLSTPA